MHRILLVFLSCFVPAVAFGQVPFPQLPQPVTMYSFEDKDWTIEPTTTVKKSAIPRTDTNNHPGCSGDKDDGIEGTP